MNLTTHQVSLFDWGRRYMASGYAVFLLSPERVPYANCERCWETCRDQPSREACGHPYCHGFYAATLDLERFERMMRVRPESALGVRTGRVSDLAVIDVDVKDGRPGKESIVPWMKRYPYLNGTRWSITASGGWHLWLRYPAEGEVRNSAGRVGAGVDVRGEGGYVVAPPTVTDDGRSYTWGRDGWDREPARMSADMLTALTLRQEMRPDRDRSGDWGEDDHPRLSQLAGTVRAAEPGQRNQILFWAACRAGEGVAHLGWDPVDTADALGEAGARAGLTASEVRRAIHNGFEQAGVRL